MANKKSEKKETEAKKTDVKKTEKKSEDNKFVSHKEVTAIKIKTVVRDMQGTAVLTPEDKGIKPFTISKHFLRTQRPTNGGYFITYEDGGNGFQSAEMFEKNYKAK